jgi:tetratricopeptide (TPR) repeat protein
MTPGEVIKQARLAMADNCDAEARSMFESLVDDPHYKGQGFLGMAVIEIRRHQFERAMVLLDLAFPCVSNPADVAYLMGTSLDGLKRRDAALDAFRVAITLDPEHAAARAALQRLLS